MKNIKQILLVISILITYSSFAQQEYKSLFWSISGNGLKKTSYLYGTFHSKDQRVFNFKKGVKKAFDKATIYAMELNLDSIDKGVMMSAMIMDSSKTLKTLLTKEDYTLVNQFFIDSIGISLFMFNKMQPLITAQMIMAKDLKSEQENALDFYWFKEAKKQGKKLVGLETMEEQITAIKSISVEQQASDLVKAVVNFDNEEEISIDKLLEIYTQGDLDSLMVVMDKFSGDTPENQKIFNEAFLYSRNKHMADRVEVYLKKGSVFMAVGAAHLPQEKGVIELLRAKGYVVKAL